MNHAGTVLVIEDDENFAATLVDVCAMAEVAAEVLTAREALARVSCDRSVEAIILDLHLPGMGGREFLSHLPQYALNAQVPVFLASGAAPKSIESASRTARERGVNIAQVISKPFSVSELVKALRDMTGCQHQVDMSDIRKAFAMDAFEQHYQPLMDLRSSRCCAVEALVRWYPKDADPVAPSVFVPMIETSSLMESFTLWTIEKAAKQWRRWADQGLNLRIAINLSANSLDIPDLAQSCAAIAQKYAMPMSALIIEITETATFDHPPMAQKCLSSLRRHQVNLAVDDFGTGFSSLKQLMTLPYSEIKIDQCFTADLLKDKTAEAIVRAVVGLSHSLGYKVIAEGVETFEIDAQLRKLGVDMGQGYFYSRALKGDDVTIFAQQLMDQSITQVGRA